MVFSTAVLSVRANVLWVSVFKLFVRGVDVLGCGGGRRRLRAPVDEQLPPGVALTGAPQRPLALPPPEYALHRHRELLEGALRTLEGPTYIRGFLRKRRYM